MGELVFKLLDVVAAIADIEHGPLVATSPSSRTFCCSSFGRSCSVRQALPVDYCIWDAEGEEWAPSLRACPFNSNRYQVAA